MPRSLDERLLELIGDVQELLDLEELQHGLLVALDRVVPSDWLSVNYMDPDPARIRVAVRPPLPEAQLETFARHAHENPIAARYARTRDSRPYRFSDLMSADQLHALTLYQEFYAPLGIEHQIAFIVQTSSEAYVAIALCRRDRDYDADERALLDRARPYLVQVYRNALAYEALRSATDRSAGEALVPRLVARGLSTRAAAVLSRVCHGQSNADVAADLGISERTVGKHLQLCYRQLGVTNRSQAAALAWTLS